MINCTTQSVIKKYFCDNAMVNRPVWLRITLSYIKAWGVWGIREKQNFRKKVRHTVQSMQQYSLCTYWLSTYTLHKPERCFSSFAFLPSLTIPLVRLWTPIQFGQCPTTAVSSQPNTTQKIRVLSGRGPYPLSIPHVKDILVCTVTSSRPGTDFF